MLPQSVKNYGVAVKKALAVPAAHHLDQVAEGDLRQQLPLELRHDQHQRRDRPHPGRRARSTSSAAATTPCASGCGPTASRSSAITVPDIVNAINQQNQIIPAGQIGGPPAVPGTEYTYTVQDAGPPAERGGVRRTSSSAPTPTARRSSSRTWRASSSARCSTTRSAATTASPAAVIAVFQIPGTNALEVADKIKKTMDDLSTRFPRDMEYLISLDTTLPVTEGINEIVHTLFEAVAARHPRGLRVPPELARHADPAGDGAGLADRRLHLLPDARLLDQRALAARPRARDRHRRRRRDRRGRGGHAPHRARDGAEGGDDQGHGGGVGPRGRDRPRPDRGVRARGLHGRHHRALLPAVRDHDRALGAALGDQRPHPEPGALGAAAEGADGQEDAADALLQLVQQGLRARHRRLRQLLGHPDPQDGPQPRLHRRSSSARSSCWGGTSRRASSPRRTRATCSPRSTCPTPPRSSAPTGDEEGRGHHQGQRGGRGLQHHHRLQPGHRRLLLEHGLLLHPAQGVGRPHDRGDARERRRRRAQPGVRAADPRGGGGGVRPAGDPRPRHGRRLHDAAPGPQRRLPRVPGPAGRALHRGGAQAARDRTRLDPLPRERAAGVRGHRPQQGAEGRACTIGRRQHDARRAARQLLRERLQPVRPRLQGLRPGRARVPAGPEAARPLLRAQRQGRDGPARHADLHPAHVRPGVHEPLQPVPLRRGQRRARAPATPRPRPSTPSRRPRRRSCRRRWATSGRTCRTRRRGPPAWPWCSPSPSCSSS